MVKKVTRQVGIHLDADQFIIIINLLLMINLVRIELREVVIVF